MIHDFDERLGWSHDWSEAPWWEPVYREAFPTMVGMRTVKQDGWAQRGAIDRLIDLRDGSSIKVDEKVRERHRDDILLETWSDVARKTPGWAHPGSDLHCDYIAYALAPSCTCYLLPYQAVRRVVKLHGDRWYADYPPQTATSRNGRRSWRTEFTCIPAKVLLDALRDALVIRWEEAPSSMPPALRTPVARRVEHPGQLTLEARS